jgi:hypothetical protein
MSPWPASLERPHPLSATFTHNRDKIVIDCLAKISMMKRPRRNNRLAALFAMTIWEPPVAVTQLHRHVQDRHDYFIVSLQDSWVHLLFFCLYSKST